MIVNKFLSKKGDRIEIAGSNVRVNNKLLNSAEFIFYPEPVVNSELLNPKKFLTKLDVGQVLVMFSGQNISNQLIIKKRIAS